MTLGPQSQWGRQGHPGEEISWVWVKPVSWDIPLHLWATQKLQQRGWAIAPRNIKGPATEVRWLQGTHSAQASDSFPCKTSAHNQAVHYARHTLGPFTVQTIKFHTCPVHLRLLLLLHANQCLTIGEKFNKLPCRWSSESLSRPCSRPSGPQGTSRGDRCDSIWLPMGFGIQRLPQAPATQAAKCESSLDSLRGRSTLRLTAHTASHKSPFCLDSLSPATEVSLFKGDEVPSGKSEIGYQGPF